MTDTKLVSVSDQLSTIARVFAKDGEDFTSMYQKRAIALFDKAMKFGFDAGFLELVYVPAAKDYGFETLLGKLHEVRVASGYKGSGHWKWEPLWGNKADVHGGYGLENEVQLFTLLQGDSINGLFCTNMDSHEQVKKSKELFNRNEGTTWLSPAAYICTQIIRAYERKNLLDCIETDSFSHDGYTETRFLWYGDEGGFIEMAGGQGVPVACVDHGGQISLDSSSGIADPCGGPRFVVGE